MIAANSEISSNPPGRMLIGVNAAHSGSSSTYVWLGHVLEKAAVQTPERLTFTNVATPSTLTAPLRATIERSGRRAGLLGATFTPDQSASTLRVEVAVGQDNPSELFARGLEMTDAQAVLSAIKAIVSTPIVTELGAGQMDVAWAITHAIDSSASGFRDLACKLTAVLILPEAATVEDVYAAWRRQAASD